MKRSVMDQQLYAVPHAGDGQWRRSPREKPSRLGAAFRSFFSPSTALTTALVVSFMLHVGDGAPRGPPAPPMPPPSPAPPPPVAICRRAPLSRLFRTGPVLPEPHVPLLRMARAAARGGGRFLSCTRRLENSDSCLVLFPALSRPPPRALTPALPPRTPISLRAPSPQRLERVGL